VIESPSITGDAAGSGKANLVLGVSIALGGIVVGSLCVVLVICIIKRKKRDFLPADRVLESVDERFMGSLLGDRGNAGELH
jgi:hypothetical protein